MVDRRKKAHRDLAASLPAERDVVVPVTIPDLAVVERMAVERQPLAAYAPRSAAAVAYRELWELIRERHLPGSP
jgi:cellulose biosynthesis protein BcsQ